VIARSCGFNSRLRHQKQVRDLFFCWGCDNLLVQTEFSKGVSKIETKALLLITVVVLLCLVGCSSGGQVANSSDVASAGVTDSRFGQMLDVIELVRMTDYSDFGRGLYDRGRIRLVTTVELDQQFNAFSWISEQCIWYSEVTFVRYPCLVDQSEILLHELAHLKTGEQTHTSINPICADFRQRAWDAGFYVDGPPAE